MSRLVLVVDDDRSILDAFRRSLRAEPYEVATADGPAAAIALLEERPVDLVICDQHMPDVLGSRLLSLVRQRWPSAVRFMLSGSASLDDCLRAINEGQVARFFVKPCRAQDVAAAIREALTQRDLLVCARRLLDRVRGYQEELRRIERENPGISVVRRDVDGAISFDEQDCAGLVREIARELGTTDHLPDESPPMTGPLERKPA